MKFEELQAIAAGAVEAVTMSNEHLVVIVVVSEEKARGSISRFACETNVPKGSDVARVCRDVANAIEAA